jgi:beta-glucosidase
MRTGQVATDMPYAIYAEGFYRAIQQLSTLGKPIIVTENGIADDRDDRRAIWVRRYLYAMSKAMEEGCDVRGYHYWSLLDNFEWAEGYQMRFGLIGVDYETQERQPREGSKAYVDIIQRFSEHA